MSKCSFYTKIEKIGEKRMTLDNIIFKTPVVRVFDKDANIAFYQESLGLKLVSEENTLAFFSGYTNSERVFIIEESPTYRTRAVVGTRKHHKTIIKVRKPSEIAQLLSRKPQIDQLFEGEKGYAFEITSPEGYTYLLHAEDTIETLQVIDSASFVEDTSFKGLSDFEVESIMLNVPDVAVAKAFYDELQLPIQMAFVEAEGDDLLTDSDETWDLEYLEFKVPKDFDWTVLTSKLEPAGREIYLDKKETLLVTADTSNIELWFSK